MVFVPLMRPVLYFPSTAAECTRVRHNIHLANIFSTASRKHQNEFILVVIYLLPPQPHLYMAVCAAESES